MIQFIVANKVVLLGFGFALSEVLALIPSVKANGLFHLVQLALQKALGNGGSGI